VAIWLEMLGTTAGVLTTFSAAPQLLTTYRTRDVSSFDLRFLLMLFFGLLLWGTYGVLIGSVSIAVFNFVGCALWLPIIGIKLYGPSSPVGRRTGNR
jgi:MtN3 and saliva related transmembrane protein